MIDGTWYLAHPLKSDDRYRFAENIKHIKRVMPMLFEAGLVTVAPYMDMVEFLDISNPEHSRIGLGADCDVVRGLRRVVFTGHKMSVGMEVEWNAVTMAGGRYINLIGVPDHMLFSFLRNNLETYGQIPYAASPLGNSAKISR